jgi:hypothetical protein
VLGRISHETGVPRAAVRTSIATVAGRLGSSVAASFVNRFAQRPQAATGATGAGRAEDADGPAHAARAQEPLQLPDRPPRGSLLTPAPPVPTSSSSLLGPISRAVELWPEVRQHDFGFGRDYQYQQEQARALEDAVQMQALAVAGNYRDVRFHDLLRPEPLQLGDAIHAAASLPHGPLALGYGSDSSRGSRRRRQPDFYNLSSEQTAARPTARARAAPRSSRARCSSRCGRCSSTASRPCGLLLATS